MVTLSHFILSFFIVFFSKTSTGQTGSNRNQCTSLQDNKSFEIRPKLQYLIESGNYKDIIKILQSVEKDFGSLVIDVYLPSLYLYRGEIGEII